MKAVVLIDTREKVNQHITNKLDTLKIPYKLKKLNYGDYSFEWNGIDYSNKIVIERKASADEVIGNFTKGRERFKREFERSKGCKVVLLIEQTMEELENGNFRSTMNVKDLKSFLKTWSNHFQLELKFTEKSQSCDLILTIFRDYCKGIT